MSTPSGKDPRLKTAGYGWVYVPKKKTKAHEPGRWKQDKKLEVVTTYLSTGSPTLTSKLTEVPHRTICDWMRSDWWEEMVFEIRNKEDSEMSQKMKGTIDKALAVVMDRLQNGDYQYDNKTGRLVQVPVKMRDAQKVLNEQLDKRFLLQNRPTKITEQQVTVDDRLANLAKQFEKFVNKNPVLDIEDVEIIEESLSKDILEIECQPT